MALGLNDVDVDGIKALDKRVRENPALGKRTVKLRSSWQRGVKALVEIGAQDVAGQSAVAPTRCFFVTMTYASATVFSSGAPAPKPMAKRFAMLPESTETK